MQEFSLLIPIILVERMTPICSASLSFSSASLSERIGPICEASSKWSNVYEDLISTLCPLISSLLLYIQQDHHQSSSITVVTVIKKIYLPNKNIINYMDSGSSPSPPQAPRVKWKGLVATETAAGALAILVDELAHAQAWLTDRGWNFKLCLSVFLSRRIWLQT